MPMPSITVITVLIFAAAVCIQSGHGLRGALVRAGRSVVPSSYSSSATLLTPSPMISSGYWQSNANSNGRSLYNRLLLLYALAAQRQRQQREQQQQREQLEAAGSRRGEAWELVQQGQEQQQPMLLPILDADGQPIAVDANTIINRLATIPTATSTTGFLRFGRSLYDVGGTDSSILRAQRGILAPQQEPSSSVVVIDADDGQLMRFGRRRRRRR